MGQFNLSIKCTLKMKNDAVEYGMTDKWRETSHVVDINGMPLPQRLDFIREFDSLGIRSFKNFYRKTLITRDKARSSFNLRPYNTLRNLDRRG